ncbi:MAG: winged helix-turn-helix transcriptional regulator [Ruminococcus sp.]|nr:winged helix-turn-helix transcriptional regulator [Ruminococcus sp.]
MGFSEFVQKKVRRIFINLSDFGRTIIPVMKAMCSYGEDYLSGINMISDCCLESKTEK